MKRATQTFGLWVTALLAIAGCGGGATTQAPATTTPTKLEVLHEAAPAKQAPPPSGERRDARFPAIVRAASSSGLELNTVTVDTLPIVKLRLVVRSGSASDPEGMPGVAQLTAAMLKEGTQKKNSQQLAEAVDFLGASLHVSSDEDSLIIDFQALAEHFDTALDLVAEIARKPALSQAELDKLKKRELARLSLQSQDPHFLAGREFRKGLYGEHPYAHVDTTAEVVKRVKRDDLARWHKRAFVPSNAFLVVAGAISPERVRAAADRAFAGWKGAPVAAATSEVSPPATSARRVVIVDRPESVQSMIYYGNLALPRRDPSFIPLKVANQVLGGSATSRLFMDLREKRSLTYGAYSDVEEFAQTAPFAAYAAVRTEVTGEAVAAFTEHLERITKEKVADAELGEAKRFLIDRFPLRIETIGKVAGLVAELRKLGLPDDYWDRFGGEIEGVTADAALAAAQRYIRPSESLLVVVGKAAAIKAALQAYGPVTVVDTSGNVLVEPATPSAAQATGASSPSAAPSAAVPPTASGQAVPSNTAASAPAQGPAAKP